MFDPMFDPMFGPMFGPMFDPMFPSLCPYCLQSVPKLQFVLTVEVIAQYMCIIEWGSGGEISASKDGFKGQQTDSLRFCYKM
jgi:hypothetical protein